MNKKIFLSIICAMFAVCAQAKTTVSDCENDYKTEQITYLGLGYTAMSFKDVKGSGHYGMNISTYNIGNSGVGFNATLSSFNFGLVNKDYVTDLVSLGPNYSYAVSSHVMVSLPVAVICDISTNGGEKKDKTKLSWGWMATPELIVGLTSNNRLALNAGIVFDGTFKGETKPQVGFRAGLNYNF